MKLAALLKLLIGKLPKLWHEGFVLISVREV